MCFSSPTTAYRTVFYLVKFSSNKEQVFHVLFQWTSLQTPQLFTFTVLTRFWQEQKNSPNEIPFLFDWIHFFDWSSSFGFVDTETVLFALILMLMSHFSINRHSILHAFFTFNSSRVQTIRSGSTSILRTLLLYVKQSDDALRT